MKASTSTPNHHQPNGLTLIELLVVLSILAVLSTVALRSVVGSFEEQSYDANIRQLEEIELAVMGSENYAGFVADIGRLPEAVGSDPLTQLSELWEKPTLLEEYEIRTFPENATGIQIEARLGTGWRGPYLQLGLARDELYDGFSNPFILETAAGNPATNQDEITRVLSLGADNEASGDSYNEDLSVFFDPTIDSFQVDVTVTNNNTSANFDLVLRLYGVDKSNGKLIVIEQQKENIAASSNGGVETITFILDGDGALQNDPRIALGPKIIRSYVIDDIPTEPDTATTIIDPTLRSRSMPKRVNISRLGPTEETLSVIIP